MKNHHLASQRLYNQRINNTTFNKPEDVVKYMVAMQAQDYSGAKWAICLRMQNANEAAIEQAITDGKILRTHLLRPTWHFVSMEDIRWLLTLTAPRIKATSNTLYKKMELTDTLFSKTNDLLEKALTENRYLARPAILELFKRAGIATDDIRFTILLMRAELDQVICNGPRVGKQFSYALLDNCAPLTPALTHEEALTKLASGYFNSRGPATIHDFANWSGLTITDATIGLENIKSGLISEALDNKTYWMPDSTEITLPKPKAYLLPTYDEFAIAYKHRDELVNPKYLKQAGQVVFDASIIVDDQIVGTWRRTISKNKVDVHLNLFGKLNKSQATAVEMAVKRYQKFLA